MSLTDKDRRFVKREHAQGQMSAARRFDGLESRMDQRFDRVDKRFDRLEACMERIERYLEEIANGWKRE